ncbi:thiamine pyrophosphate-binding protein [Streptomyces puniciscabiei]
MPGPSGRPAGRRPARRGAAPCFVQAHGAESAALMACADPKLTGRLGCCLTPTGGAALRLLGGLYDAAADRTPLLAVVGEETAGARLGGEPATRWAGGGAVRHRDRLAGLPPLVFCVLTNGDLNRLTWQRRAAAGDPLIPLSPRSRPCRTPSSAGWRACRPSAATGPGTSPRSGRMSCAGPARWSWSSWWTGSRRAPVTRRS